MLSNFEPAKRLLYKPWALRVRYARRWKFDTVRGKRLKISHFELHDWPTVDLSIICASCRLIGQLNPTVLTGLDGGKGRVGRASSFDWLVLAWENDESGTAEVVWKNRALQNFPKLGFNPVQAPWKERLHWPMICKRSSQYRHLSSRNVALSFASVVSQRIC